MKAPASGTRTRFLRWPTLGLAILTGACLSSEPGPRLAHFPEAADSAKERREPAESVDRRLELSPRVVVDPEEDPGWRALGRAPSPAFVLDRDGRVVARQLWVRPEELRRILLDFLEPADGPEPAPTARGTRR